MITMAAPRATIRMRSTDAIANVRLGALAFAFVFAVLTLYAAFAGGAAGPVLPGFLPACATIWACAELLTAYFLFTQFYVSGTLYYAAVATAYLISGTLTAPYLAHFPGLFQTGALSRGDQQISIALWVIWHSTFPLIVLLCDIFDPQLRRRLIPRKDIVRILAIFIFGTFGFCAVADTAITTFSSALPTMVYNAHFTTFFQHVAAPLVAGLNGVGFIIFLLRYRSANVLQIWLFVAMYTGFLDGILNAVAPARYTFAWYVGKLETLTTASVVLGMLLYEVAMMYRRTAENAAVDALTGLRNRRALDDYLAWAFDYARRRRVTLGLLVADIDNFKGYNDRYGHSAGDECLRKVAAALRGSLLRASDVVARYGGEEFVVLSLPDTDERTVVSIAERMRAAVERLAIAHDASPHGVVTISIGVATTGDLTERLDSRGLFDVADAALYEAKGAGRNMVVCGTFAPAGVSA